MNTALSTSRRSATWWRPPASACTAPTATPGPRARAASTALSSKAKRRPSARRVNRRASRTASRSCADPSLALSAATSSHLRSCAGSHELRARRTASRQTASSSRSAGGTKPGRGRLSVCKTVRRAAGETRAGSSTWWSASRSSSPLTPTNHGAAFRSSWTARSATTAAGWWTTIGSVGGDFWGRRGLAPRRSTGWGLLPTAMPFDRCALRHYACEKRFDAMLPFARAFYGCRSSATMQGRRNTRARSSFDTMLPFCELSELF